MATLWLVVAEQFEYDCFVSAAVWAETPEQAEQLVRSAPRGYDYENNVSHELSDLPAGESTTFTITPAPTEGIAHEHWHAG